MDLTSDVYPRFKILKLATKAAGVLGVAQSVIWIVLSIFGLLAYYSVLTFSNAEESNSPIGSLFYELYFRGSGNINQSKGNISQSDVNIIVWIYLIFNTLWLGASASILKKIDEKHLRRTNIFLYIWVFNTLVICALDLAVGIVFGLEYDAFARAATAELEKNRNSENLFVLNLCLVVTISIVIVALKGFILWIINVCFAIYFFMETFVINEFSTSRISLVTRDVISDTQSIHSIITKSPIVAYDAQNPYQEQPPVRLNTDALERANKMSIMGLKERFANRQNPERFREYSRKWEPNVPDPDYTPPMPRSHKLFRDDRTRF